MDLDSVCVFQCGAVQLMLETMPPERQIWGGILATFCDPSGNQLQIVQRPATG